MKVYHVHIRKNGISPFADSLHTSRAEARKAYRAAKKGELTREVTLSSVAIRTDLKAPDWVALVGSDMPGGEMVMAPRDLMLEETREVLARHAIPR